jgi:hypothetical protein
MRKRTAIPSRKRSTRDSAQTLRQWRQAMHGMRTSRADHSPETTPSRLHRRRRSRVCRPTGSRCNSQPLRNCLCALDNGARGSLVRNQPIDLCEIETALLGQIERHLPECQPLSFHLRSGIDLVFQFPIQQPLRDRPAALGRIPSKLMSPSSPPASLAIGIRRMPNERMRLRTSSRVYDGSTVTPARNPDTGSACGLLKSTSHAAASRVPERACALPASL